MMASTSFFDMARIKDAFTGIGKTYNMNWISSMQAMRDAMAMLPAIAEFEALSANNLEPDVLLGYFPIYLVNTLESGKSNKDLRFRGIGTHLMGFQKGARNSLVIKFSLVGPLAPAYLQLLDTTYYYGSEYQARQDMLKSELPGAGPAEIPGSDVVLKSDGAYSVQTGLIADQGLSDTYARDFNTPNGAILPNDMKVEKVANSQVDLLDAEVSERKTTVFSNGTKDTGDWELIVKRRTFTVITRNEIFPRMYIETMLKSERKDLALGEIEVDLLLRRYTEPPVKTRYYWDEAATEVVPVNKDAIKKRESWINRLKKKVPTPARKQKIAKTQQAMKIRTRYTAGAGRAKTMQVTGVDPKSVIEYDKIGLWFNLAWRAWGTMKRSFWSPLRYSSDPIVGRILEGTSAGFKQQRALPLNQGNTQGLDVVSGSLFSETKEGDVVAPHQCPSINNGNASSTTYQQGVTFNTDPTLVTVTLNGKTGVTEYHVPLVDWKSFLHYIGEEVVNPETDEDYDEIKDVLMTTEAKQADLENTIIYGCNAFKITGLVPHDGYLEFTSPIQCSFRVEMAMGSGTGQQITPKMKVGIAEFTVQPGLVYYLGTSAPTSWYEDEDDGMMHVNKPVMEELYLYMKSVQLSGNDFTMVGFFFYPLYGA
jgi:hypothetical protein